MTPELLAERVRLVAAGKRFVDPEVTRLVLPDAGEGTISGQELAVLQALARGLSRAQVAAEVPLGERQVRRLERRARERLGASTTEQAVAMAVAMGLIRP